MAARNKDYHKKLYRLVRILNRLETEGRVTPRDLADEFNVSMRTAQRDIELINMAEFPLVSMSKGVYSFVPGFSLKRLPMTREEASLLAFLCDVAHGLGGGFAKSFRSLSAKLAISRTGESPLRSISPVVGKARYPAMNDAHAAVEQGRMIEIAYDSGKTHRLRPLKIVYSDGFWYLAAQMEGHRDFTIFRLDRIKSLEMLDETFLPPKRALKALGKSMSIWAGMQRPIRVQLRVASDAAGYFADAIHFPAQRRLKILRDGAVLLESTISHPMEIIPTVLKWLPHIRVIRPKGLRGEIRSLVRHYARIA